MIVQGLYVILMQELRILRHDISPFAVLFIMPALAIMLMTPALGAVLREQGFGTASGVELALPGMTVMFGTLGAAFLGFAIFREHQWQSWQRLLASPVPLLSVLTAKMLVPILLVFSQQMVLLIMAIGIYDMPIPASLYEQILLVSLYAATGLSYALTVISLGLVAAAFCQSLQQMNAIIHIGALLLAATCGAFIPLVQMPEVIQHLAKATPSFWLVDAQTHILLQQNKFSDCLLNITVLCVQALLFVAIASMRFRALEVKRNWA